MENLGFKGTWEKSGVKIKLNVDIISFEEDNSSIFYCPALDVSGYGENEDEAQNSLQLALGEFFDYTLNKGTFVKELKKMGWIVTKSKRKPMTPPTMEKLLRDNENFSRIFNTHDFRKFNTKINMPTPMATA